MLCLWLCALLAVAGGKLVAPLVGLSEESRWTYVTKAMLAEGRGTWTFRAKMHRPVNDTSEELPFLSLNIYQDGQWLTALEASDCQAHLSPSTEKQIRIPLNGTWSSPLVGSLQQLKGVHMWYFAISDCAKNLPEKAKIRVEVSIKTRDGSEFSYERESLLYIYAVGALTLLLTLGRRNIELWRRYRRTEDWNSREVCLGVAIALELTGLILQFGHLGVYAYNGYGVMLFDFFSQLFHSFSQLLITILLILISTGWTLTFRAFPAPEGYVPVILLTIILNLATVAVSKVTADSHSQFSDYEGLAGWLYLGTRLLLWLWFLLNLRSLRPAVQGRTHDFLLSFGLFSSLYFLSMPCAVVLSWLHPPYQRVMVLALAGLIVQIAAFVQLHWLFTDKEGSYYRVSTASEGILPGKTRAN